MNPTKPTIEEIKKMEDEVRERCNQWDEIRQAIAYHYLFASGMSLEKSRDIRRKVGASQ